MPEPRKPGETQAIRKPFANTDERLREAAAGVVAQREKDGVHQLVGGLVCAIINTEAAHHDAGVRELLRRTGHGVADAFVTADRRWCVLSAPGSADLVITARTQCGSPFACPPTYPMCKRCPNARLETFVFACRDLDAYVGVQQARGVTFLTDRPEEHPDFRFIQTTPSACTRNSIGFIQWRDGAGSYRPGDAVDGVRLPDHGPARIRNHVKHLDHAATRVEARDRDPAILEFMALTAYDFAFAIYVDELNSITNVARLEGAPFALVFTSGVMPSDDAEGTGPTERFVARYGPRTHHLAFHTEEIDDVYAAMQADGQEFLVELVGGRQEGLKQTFTTGSPNTLLVNEYIYRYGGFDGFFTRNNVAALTEATGKQ